MTRNVQRAITMALSHANRPLSRREIYNLTWIEICTLCNPLLELERHGIIYRAKMGICQETGKSVTHYDLTARKAKK